MKRSGLAIRHSRESGESIFYMVISTAEGAGDKPPRYAGSVNAETTVLHRK